MGGGGTQNPTSSIVTQQQVTDPATQGFRNAVYPILQNLATVAPRVYGSNYNGVDANGNPIWTQNADQPLVAGQNAEITQAANQIKAMQGAQTGTFQNAATGIGNAAGMDIYGAGAGAYGQAGNLYNQAAAGQSGLAGQGQFNAATGMFDQAAGTNTAGQYQPYGAAATDLYGQSTSPTGLSAASPYLQAAGQSSVQNIGQYMNPYNEQVTNRIAQLGARNLSENILPSISSDFIKAGGYGSTRQRDLVGRAARDTQESILGQQAQALQQGYGQGLTASAADLSRYGQLAGTAGSLGTQQQQLLQGAASGISGIGQAGAGLAGSDAARQLQAGQGLANIGQSDIQASQADLARVLAAGQGQAGVGAGLGNLTQANAANQLAAGQADIGLGQADEQMNLRDTAALQGVGESEQAQQQRVIDANKAQVSQEVAAPFQNVDQATAAAAGTPGQTNTSQTTTQVAPPSLTGQLAGLGTAAVGAYGLTKAKGGAIKKGSLKKSSYGKLPKRGLSMFARAS